MFSTLLLHDLDGGQFYSRWGIDSSFPLCSHQPMDELPFKVVKMHGAKDEVIARVENFLICKAAFEKALFVYPDAHLEMRQGARIILKSKEDPAC
jgi:hypothetical protein